MLLKEPSPELLSYSRAEAVDLVTEMMDSPKFARDLEAFARGELTTLDIGRMISMHLEIAAIETAPNPQDMEDQYYEDREHA